MLIRSTATLVAIVALTAPALAQTTVTRSETVASGKTVRLAIVPNLKKDCTAGPMPEIRVSGAPKNGSLVTKVGKIKTPASYRCPNKDAAVQAVFYESKANFTGADEVVVDIKNSDGQVQTQTIKITVGSAAGKTGGEAKKEGTEL
ncbi:4-aminobutyrate aminotransferase [uncultured Methylobacterium sp.]|uniref:4-aminobutyrate aminotransferase n=1 Tax=uncultured Methylobacterium sp. TaxID=157278 RepID=UPI0035CA8D03